jgi:hypothetical protein
MVQGAPPALHEVDVPTRRASSPSPSATKTSKNAPESAAPLMRNTLGRECSLCNLVDGAGSAAGAARAWGVDPEQPGWLEEPDGGGEDVALAVGDDASTEVEDVYGYSDTLTLEGRLADGELRGSSTWGQHASTFVGTRPEG